MTTTGTDLLGRPLGSAETRLLEVYEGLKELAARDDLPPTAVANARAALAQLAQAVTSLALNYEHLADLDV